MSQEYETEKTDSPAAGTCGSGMARRIGWEGILFDGPDMLDRRQYAMIDREAWCYDTCAIGEIRAVARSLGLPEP